MRISDWSSDVCSSDLLVALPAQHLVLAMLGGVVAEHVHRAQDAALGILDGLDADQRGEARAVVAFDDDLLVAPGAAAGEPCGHGAAVVRHGADRQSKRLNSSP